MTAVRAHPPDPVAPWAEIVPDAPYPMTIAAFLDGFIEVHHLRPIASCPGEIEVDPRTDMAVLCANCHRMVHRKVGQPLTIAELRQLVATMRAS